MKANTNTPTAKTPITEYRVMHYFPTDRSIKAICGHDCFHNSSRSTGVTATWEGVTCKRCLTHRAKQQKAQAQPKTEKKPKKATVENNTFLYITSCKLLRAGMDEKAERKIMRQMVKTYNEQGPEAAQAEAEAALGRKIKVDNEGWYE